MVSIVKKIVVKVKARKTPGKGALAIVCGIVNCIFFGIGTIIAGAIDKSKSDVVIGLLQLFVPLVGWIWSIIWGILMIMHGL